MELLIWSILLTVQSAAFTWLSRARNSRSLAYHAVASTISNLIWFAAQCFMVDGLIQARTHGDVPKLVWMGLIYTASTVVGSVSSHHVLQTYFEFGNRKVGT